MEDIDVIGFWSDDPEEMAKHEAAIPINHNLKWPRRMPRDSNGHHIAMLLVLHDHLADRYPSIEKIIRMTAEEKVLLLAQLNHDLGIKPLKSLGGI